MLICAPTLSLAQENIGKVTSVKKGDVAKFSGVLMSNEVATRLYLDSKFSTKECDLKINEKLSIEKLILGKDIKLLETKLEIEIDRFSKIIIAKDSRINFLEKHWTPRPWYKSSEFWFSTGIIGGILITVAAGYSLSQINR
jgi:hypothetical protein